MENRIYSSLYADAATITVCDQLRCAGGVCSNICKEYFPPGKKKKVRCSINQSDHAWTFQLWKAINNFRIFNSILSICVLDFSAPLMRPSGVNKEGEEVGGLPAQSRDVAPFCPQNAKYKTQNINKSTWNEFP